MSLLRDNPAKAVLTSCRALHADAEDLITDKLRELATLLHEQQRLVLGHIAVYRDQLSARQTPSVDEFYDLIELLHEDTFGQRIVSDDAFDESLVTNWRNRKEVPGASMRRHVMLALLDEYLEHCVLSGLGRLSRAIARTGGDDLFAGEWILPVRDLPSCVTMQVDGRWRICDVMLPGGLSWYDRPRRFFEYSVLSYPGLPDGIVDMMMCDIIMPKGSHSTQKLHTRLQKIPRVGAAGARVITAWLTSELECTIVATR